MTDGSGTSSWAWVYDSLHRITSTTGSSGTTIAYGYDLNGNQTSITYPGSHTVTYTPDDDSQISTVADWLSHTTSFGYDPNNNLTTETLPSSPNVVDTFGYNEADQLTSISDVASSTTLFGATYGRDGNGRLRVRYVGAVIDRVVSVQPAEPTVLRRIRQHDCVRVAAVGCTTYGFDPATTSPPITAPPSSSMPRTGCAGPSPAPPRTDVGHRRPGRRPTATTLPGTAPP